MSRQGFELGGVSVRPGERTIVNIPLPGLYTETTVGMPVHVVHGRREGPTLFVSAAVHGDEINGVEIIRRILRAQEFGEDLGDVSTLMNDDD